MKGSATVEIDVKSGAIVDLRLEAPGNVNVLGVSGPSLRSHEVRDVDGRQVIDMEFTREMEGQFRVEVNYERIMTREASETAVPAISVTDAEVEHGRIAIEALTAVEVRAATVELATSAPSRRSNWHSRSPGTRRSTCRWPPSNGPTTRPC
jgi:hypothetical protein